MALSFSHRDDAGMRVIAAVGDLDLSTAGTFEHEIATAVTAEGSIGVTGVVVDLSEVAFVDSAGINALLKARRVAEQHRRAFRVERASGLVREVLVMTGVWSLLSEVSP